jgi:tetratricopeptide (TPR) repeat protein
MSATGVSSPRLTCLLVVSAMAICGQTVERIPRHRGDNEFGYYSIPRVPIPDIPRPNDNPPPSGTISANILKHKVPAKAEKAFNKGLRAVEKKNTEEAIRHFQQAVTIDPEFYEARNNLGGQYIAMGKPEPAASEFEELVRRYPRVPHAYTNLAVSYVIMERYADAERAARQSANLEHGNPRASLLIGTALVFQDKFSDEAMQHLKQVQDQFPDARLMLARAQAARGDISGARENLKEYLKTAPDNGRKLVNEWLKTLDQAEAAAATRQH